MKDKKKEEGNNCQTQSFGFIAVFLVFALTGRDKNGNKRAGYALFVFGMVWGGFGCFAVGSPT